MRTSRGGTKARGRRPRTTGGNAEARYHKVAEAHASANSKPGSALHEALRQAVLNGAHDSDAVFAKAPDTGKAKPYLRGVEAAAYYVGRRAAVEMQMAQQRAADDNGVAGTAEGAAAA